MENIEEIANQLINCSEAELEKLNGYLRAAGVHVAPYHTNVTNLPTPTCPQGYVFSNGRCVPDVG